MKAGEEPCQPLDYSYNNPLDLSRTELSKPVVRGPQSLVKAAGRNCNLSNLQKDWSDDVEGEGKPWRYPISSENITTSLTVDLTQPDQAQAQVSLSEGEDTRVSRGFSDSEELFVFPAPRSEVKCLNLWSFSRKSKNHSDISRYSGLAGYDELPKQPRLLEEREDREDCIELLDQAGGTTQPSDSGLLLEHENSILCDPELQMFPITTTDITTTQPQPQLRDNNCQELLSVHSVSPSLPEISLQETPSTKQLGVSDSESGRVEFLGDDLMIDLP